MQTTLSLSVLLLAATAAAQTPCHAEFDGNTFADSWNSSHVTMCIKTKAARTLVIHAVQVFTGERTGIATVGLWSHDASKDEPQRELARGSWSMDPKNSWQGANLNQPVVLTQGQTFWVSWIPVERSQTSAQAYGSSLPGIQTYKWSRTNSAPWNGPYRGFQWKFRLHCSRLYPGTQVLGKGCADGFGVVGHYDAPATPGIGNQDFTLLGVQLPPAAPAMLVLGLQRNFPAFDLTPAGGPGCFLHSDTVVLLPRTTSSGTPSLSDGTLLLKAAIPNDPNLRGAFLRSQLWVKDASSRRPLQAVFTNGVGITVQ